MEKAYEECLTRKCTVVLRKLTPKDIEYLSKKMDSLVCSRRKSSPNIVKKLWSCIQIIKDQRQIPSAERIVRHMVREHNLSKEVILSQLDYCVHEGLIRHTRSSGRRGSKTGVQQEAYRLPKVEPVRDFHDWYCWKCHQSGEVIKCTRCFRVYHPTCLKDFDKVKDKLLCEVCYDIFSDESLILRKELNELLQFSYNRLSKILVVEHNEIIPSEITNHSDVETDTDSEGGENLDLAHSEWQIDFLNFKIMDLKIMKSKLSENGYSNIECFRADAELIYHNTVIVYGAESKEAEAVQYMVEECKRDIKEILICKDCFRASNLRTPDDWFCIPCNPPHELVYAKQKGYCFWPAKVIKMENDNYDVRFFGFPYSRAIIHKKFIRSISEDISKEVKKSVSWNKAYAELLKHQKYLLNTKQEQNNGEDIDILGRAEEDLKLHFPPFSNREVLKLHTLSCSKSESPERDAQSNKNMETLKPHALLPCNTLKVQGRKASGISESSLPSLVCGHSRNPEPVNNSDSLLHNKRKSTSDDSSISSKRSKRSKSFLQLPRAGVSVKDLSFDPNALQEEMGKFLSDGVDEGDHIEGTVPSVETTTVLLDSEKISSTNSNNIEPNKIMENNKNELILDLKMRLTKYEQEIKKLKRDQERALKDQERKHRNEIYEIKKHCWCQVCFNKATYYCCYNTSYCSINCQRLHWKDHQESCKHKKNR